EKPYRTIVPIEQSGEPLQPLATQETRRFLGPRDKGNDLRFASDLIKRLVLHFILLLAGVASARHRDGSRRVPVCLTRQEEASAGVRPLRSDRRRRRSVNGMAQRRFPLRPAESRGRQAGGRNEGR